MRLADPLPSVANPAPSARVRLALFWSLIGAIGAVAVLPYAMALSPKLFARVPVALPVFVVAQFVQAIVMLFLASWIGLRLGSSLGLHSPLASAFVYRRPRPALPLRTLIQACMAGFVVGAAVLISDKLLVPFMPPATLPPPASIELWKRLLACLYGGITEEVLARLFVMTLIVWAVQKCVFRDKQAASFPVVAAGIVGAAILFGAGHLAATAEVWPLTPTVIARTVLLNAVAGITFGFLYWRRGLEHAMCAHFCADIVMHVVGGA